MRKIIYFAAAISAITHIAQSHEYLNNDKNFHYSHFYIGTIGGFNLSSMYGSGIDLMDLETTPEWSGNWSLSIGYKPSKWFAFESGTSVVGRGYAGQQLVEQKGYPFTLKHEYRDRYFEIPLVIKPTVILTPKKLFYGIGGVSYANRTSANYKLSVSYERYGETKNETLTEKNLLQDGIGFPIDTFGNTISIPYKDLNRMHDISAILGLGWELGNAGFSKSWAFVFEIKYLIGLIDMAYVTPNGERKLAQGAYQLFRFLEENKIDPRDVGIDTDREYVENPIKKNHSLLISIGFKHYW